jgi:MFS family permease
MIRPRLAGVLPVTRAGRVLALGIGISAAGSGAFLGSSVLYFVGELGFPASRVGLALSIAGCCGILSPIPFGRLADRVHPARALPGPPSAALRDVHGLRVPLFLFNAASFLIVAVTVGMVPRVTAATVAPRPAPAPGPFRDPRYLVLALGNGILCLFDSVLLVMFPAWLAVGHRLPTVIAPLMLSVNAVLTIAGLVPASRRAHGRAAARRVIAISAASMALGSIAFAAADALRPAALVIGLIGIAVVAFTLGEVFENVGAYELSFDQAPRDRRGQYVALFHAVSFAQGVIGPLLMTAVLLPAGPVGWLALVPVFGLGLLAFRWGSRSLPRTGVITTTGI